MSSAGSKGVAAETRIVLLVCLSVIVLLLDSLVSLFAVFFIVFAFFLSARVGWKRVVFWLMISLATVWGYLLTQSIFYPYRPRTILFEIISPSLPLLGSLTGGIAIYWEGALYGLIQSLRLLTMITAGLTVVWTTTPSSLLGGLRRLRLPHRLAFMVTTALRFLPAIAKEARIVMSAMRARGYPLTPTRPWSYLKALAAGLSPILVRNIRRATMLADSVESRGFSKRRAIIPPRTDPVRATERVLLIGMPAIALLLIGAKLLLYAAQNGFFYSETLEWLYAFVEAAL